MSTTEPSVLLEKRNKIAYITFNRPEKLNAMRLQDYQLVAKYINELDQDDSIRAIIFTGKGRAFSSGDDMNWWSSAGATSDNLMAGYTKDVLPRGALNEGQKYKLTLMESGKVSIAAVNGLCWYVPIIYAVDFVVAADVAVFHQGDLAGGACPGGAETQTLPRMLGRRRALEIMLLGEDITAQEAYRMGLVNKVVPLSQLMSEAESIAQKAIRWDEGAIKATKLCVTRGQDLPFQEACHLETLYLMLSSRGGGYEKHGTEFRTRRR